MENASPTFEPVKRRSIWLKIWQFPLVAMLVALALVIGAAWLTSLATAKLISPNLGPVASTITSVFLLIALCLVIYKLVIRHLGRKKHDDLPLDLKALRDVMAGIGGGAVLISLCVALAAIFGVYRLQGTDVFADWVNIIFLFGIYAGFFEELLIRGIILRWLEELTGTWIALVISALIFGFLHAGNDNATFFSSLAIAIEAGVLLGTAYILTRSLWLAIGLHAGWNT
ncbi:MAG: type II CAAX endopeptidase family protein, partial [Alteraurantiacibacter sp.]